MRRLSRLERSIDLLSPSTNSGLLSRSCSAYHRAPAYTHYLPRATFSSHSPVQARNNNREGSSGPNITERLRRKLWGTDKPPGQEDPYDTHNIGASAAETAIEEVAAAPAEDVEVYEPAKTWDGLKHVGWFGPDLDFRFKGFLPSKILTSEPALMNALHRAVVEVFTLQQAGRPLEDVTNLGNNVLEYDPCAGVDVVLDGKDVKLNYPSGRVQSRILQSAVAKEVLEEDGRESATPELFEEDTIEELEESKEAPWEDIVKADQTAEQTIDEQSGLINPPDAVKEADALAAAEAEAKEAQLRQLISKWDKSWFNISIRDPNLKLAILKRTLQLTGRRVPDPAIASLSTVRSLFLQLIAPPPANKLADVLLKDNKLTSLPNVQIFGRRVTPIDKDITVGRWKVIEKELKGRGLPVVGHN